MGPFLRRGACALLVLTSAGCFGLNDDDLAVLDVHQQNSQMYFQSGSWLQAMHQANMALALDEDLVGMRLIKGHCLTRLGASRGSREQVDGAIAVFDTLIHGDGRDDYRAWLGGGQAYLARARQAQAEVERIDRRLASDFLTDAGRRAEETDRKAAVRIANADTLSAEDCLRKVLTFELQTDNIYAMIDLVLALVDRDGNQDLAATYARRAVVLLQEAISLTRETLSKNMNLTARGRISMQKRIDEALGNERMLRDLVITLEYNRGSYQRCLEDYEALEDRGLMQAPDHYNRALILESMAMWTEAIDDYQSYLRMRARTLDYDDQADAIFSRIEELEHLLASLP